MALSFGPLAYALAFALVAAIGLAWLLGGVARRHSERDAGIHALSDLKWREFQRLVLEALRRRGYVEEGGGRPIVDAGYDLVLLHHGERRLFACKHGTGYRLTAAAVRDFAEVVRLQGAGGGVIVTHGSIDPQARALFPRDYLELIDGRELWPQIEGVLPSALRDRVRAFAANQARRRFAIGGFGCVVLAIGVYLLAAAGTATKRRSSAEIAASHAVDGGAAPAPSADAASTTAETKPEPAVTDEAELAARRAAVARRVRTLPAVTSVTWSTPSTLVLVLRANARAEDPLAETCRILSRYRELDFTRLQTEPPPGDDAPVRWRQCGQRRG